MAIIQVKFEIEPGTDIIDQPCGILMFRYVSVEHAQQKVLAAVRISAAYRLNEPLHHRRLMMNYHKFVILHSLSVPFIPQLHAETIIEVGNISCR